MSMIKTDMNAGTGNDTSDFETVVADPAAYYVDPEAIVKDDGLVRSERLRLLNEWAQDIVDRQVADNEGMGLDTAADETQLLRRVNVAIEAVEASDDAPAGLLERVWKRLTG